MFLISVPVDPELCPHGRRFGVHHVLMDTVIRALRDRRIMGERLGVKPENQRILDQAYWHAETLEIAVFRAKDATRLRATT